MPYVRRRRLAPRRRPNMRRRRIYRPRLMKSSLQLHAPKKFVSTFSLPIDSFGAGTHADGYNRQRLDVSLFDIPIFANLYTLYGQFAITSVKLTYVPIYNSSTGTAGQSVPNIAIAEDKNSDVALTYTAIQHQDNMKTFSSARKWSMFFKKPRPLLYQWNGGNAPVKTITPAKQIHWLSPASPAQSDPSTGLSHTFAQMCVEDMKGIAANATATVGTLYYKVYLVCKEQRVATNVNGEPIA